MQRLTAQTGITIAELMVTVAVIGILVATGVLGLRQSYFNFSTSKQRVLNDLRLTRSKANTRGAHYRISFASSSYLVERLQDEDGDGVWDPDPKHEPREVALPRGVSADVTLTGAGGSDASGIEFDSRGMVVPVDGQTVAELTEITVSDNGEGKSAIVQVWPSGQVQLAANSKAP